MGASARGRGRWAKTDRQTDRQTDSVRLVHRVLIIEDDAKLRRATERSLRGRGVEVIGVADAEAALAAPLDDVDVILADVWLGPRRVHEIVADLLRHRVPIVAWSGLADAEDGFELRELGVHRLLSKPVETDALVEALESAARQAARGAAGRAVDFKRMRPVAVRRLLRWTLAQSGGSVSAAAVLLGYTRPALQYWIRKLR